MTLLQECLEKLQDHIVLSELETEKYFDLLEHCFVFTNWGRIDWNVIQNHIRIDGQLDMEKALNKCNQSINENSQFIILWDSADLPAVKIPLSSLNENLEDITAVSFDTWVFSEEHSLVIEFYHEGETTIGTANSN
jgi:hypothetical protein